MESPRGSSGLRLTAPSFPSPLSSTFSQSPKHALEQFVGLSFVRFESRDMCVGASGESGVFGRVGMGTPFPPHLLGTFGPGRAEHTFLGVPKSK